MTEREPRWWDILFALAGAYLVVMGVLMTVGGADLPRPEMVAGAAYIALGGGLIRR